MADLGFIGIGTIGLPMARRLVDAGHRVFGYDTNVAALDGFVAEGGLQAGTPREVAEKCRVVFTSLPGPDEVESLTLGEAGMWRAAKAKTVHLDVSTIGPACSRKLEREARTRRIRFIEGAVARGAVVDGAPRVVLLVGGNVDYIDLARNRLEEMADRVLYCGAVGHAQTAKLVNNVVALGLAALLGESLALGVKAGVPVDLLCEALHEGTAQNRVLDELFPMSVLRGDWRPGLKLELAAKDLRLAGELARESGIEFPFGAKIEELYEAARRRGWGDLSAHSVVRLIEEDAGVTLRSVFQQSSGDG